MSNRAKFWLLGLIPLIWIGGLVVAAFWKLPQWITDGYLQDQLSAFVIGAGLLLALVFVVVWAYLDRVCFVPLQDLARAARDIAHSHAGYALEMPPSYLLGELPARVRELGEALQSRRQEVIATDTAGTREVEEQKSQLKTVLRELSEGVLICDAHARIRLYNSAALKLLPNPDALAPGHSLYEFCSRASMEKILELLRHRERDAENDKFSRGDAEFICATVDEEVLLHCRMSLLPLSSKSEAAFVITFRDLASQVRQTAPQQLRIDMTIEELHRPLAILQTDIENLAQFTAIETRRRQLCQRVVADSADLNRKLETLVKDLGGILAMQWPMNDIYSADLLSRVVHRFGQHVAPQVRLIGPPLWLHVDSQLVPLLVEHVIEQLYTCGAGYEFEIECLPGKRRVYLDIIWQGRPISIHRIREWSEQRLQDRVGAASVAEVLRRHNSELWSQAHRKPGKAMLRIPLPISQLQWQSESEVLADRHEFHDFALYRGRVGGPEELTDKPLSELSYVVFDIEITGPEPFKGDEIIQVAAVRAADRRVLDGQIFDRLVNPGKSIPKSSIRFHGITDEQVKDKLTIEKVLAQFKTFVGDGKTVLVTHHAALKMKFLKLKAKQAGIRFDNPVLDTLLLSAYMHDYTDAHDLNTIAGRLGVSISDRDIGPGGALVIAHVFIRLLSLLEVQDIKTLGQALEASGKIVEMRKRQAQF